MKICVIGTGYVGLVAGACLADTGNEVICADTNSEKIEFLKKGLVPIYEPGLEELVKVNLSEGRLSFTTDIDYAVKTSKVCFIAVGTPQDVDGSCDLTAVCEVSKTIAKSMNEYKVIVNKSTVPVGTAEKTTKIIAENTDFEFDVVSNPEFLKQGAAVDDFLKPDRIVIGADSRRAEEIMQEIYSPFLRTGNRIILMDVKSAEMTKYAANAFLATKISFMNEIANLCEHSGADAEMVRIGISTDSRIGSQFLFPGLGYGGSCFPKDVNALIAFAEQNNCPNEILKAVDKTNKQRRMLFLEKIYKYFDNSIKDKVFAIWGLSFKPKTDDMREAPSITIINELLARGAKIRAYDPKAFDKAKSVFGNKIIYAPNAYDALIGADALLLLTEWNEFCRPNTDKLSALMKNKVIFDGRNQYNGKRLREQGFDYICTGRKPNFEQTSLKV